MGRSPWPRVLRGRSTAARLLRSCVRIPPGTWMFVCCECYVLSGRGLCDELITRPEESYRLWCVVVCDQETSKMRRPWPALGRSANKKKRRMAVRDTTKGYSVYLGGKDLLNCLGRQHSADNFWQMSNDPSYLLLAYSLPLSLITISSVKIFVLIT